MLKIQRASAGSGKTYALAKNFILNLIAFKNQNGEWQIRTEKQIEEALPLILAITFTNKATNEMKERIINNLSQLSLASEIRDTDTQLISKIPYLKEFQELTGESFNKIGRASNNALKTILNDFSLFKISTIDSFFQEILRTFTFEANINDSYQLEIDSTYVTDAAIDSAIHQLDSRPQTMGNAIFWLKTIMRNESQKTQRWNVFNKKSGQSSVYSKLRRALNQLESEDFKDIKEELEVFFEKEGQSTALVKSYQKLQELANQERENLLKAIKKKRNDAEDTILQGNIPDNQLSKTFLQHLVILSSLQIKDEISFKFNKILNDGSVFLKKFRTEGHPLDREALELYGLVSEWINPAKDSYYKSWLIYGELMPYMGLILEIKNYLAKVLETNNLIQISDTSFILKKIIGEDDSSFVYERLGNRIDNYLIDEFQDTSGMQWDIIHPLLSETVSKGNESLIIGDPKQSIYRFRNADHTLITEVVPAAFPNHESAGFSKEENTNWRSHTGVVKFNNFLFKSIAFIINEISREKGGSTDFRSLYSNVVQYPHNQSGKGYVEIRMLEKPFEDFSLEDYDFPDSSNNSQKDWFDFYALSNIGPLVSSLIQRGYRQKDIGVLVNTNDKGKEVVESFIAYNEKLPETTPKINFISEESLLVSSSPAVELIIGVIEKFSHPGAVMTNIEDESEDKLRRKYINWNHVKMNFLIYSMAHPELSSSSKIIRFVNEPQFDASLSSLLESLPTPSLTSMVESIVSTFIDSSLRDSEALYISALQDLVNEYVQNHPDDPASFLEWWKSRGSRMAVSSPEGIDAVQIMTIHKSKGLEFKCVILPFATDSFSPSTKKDEWRWVNPLKLGGVNLPSVIPVRTISALKGSVHEDIYSQYYDQVLTDKLNMYYVAFTRAKNELYVFTKKSTKKTPDSLQDFIYQILFGKFNTSGLFEPEELPQIISPVDLEISEDEMKIIYGEPFSRQQIELENLKEKKHTGNTGRFFEGYYVNKSRPKLKSVSSRIMPSGEFYKD